MSSSRWAILEDLVADDFLGPHGEVLDLLKNRSIAAK